MGSIKNRLRQYVDDKGISMREFCRNIDVSATFLANDSEVASDKLLNIVSAYPDIDLYWLVMGETLKPDLREADNVFALKTDRLLERQQIPVYDMSAIGGLVPLFTKDFSQQVVEVIETGLIPKCDGGIRIVGDSMSPLFNSGDIVFYKQIEDFANGLFLGEIYLISFDLDGDEYIAVKYIRKSDKESHVSLESFNPNYSPISLHIKRIRALALVKASLKLNAIK